MRLIYLISIFLIFPFHGFSTGNLDIYDLRCENIRNPQGIDNTAPRFSWKIKSVKNGTEQKAFQLMVASNPSLLDVNQADLWNSGKVESSSSVLVSYRGKILSSGAIACWKIRIWDESGKVSAWSKVAEFSIGLLNKQDWQAAYIGFPSKNGFSECPQLMKSFDLENTNSRMLLHVNSLGYHEVFLNGKKVGDGVLYPAVSQFNKRSLVVTYDVSSLVKKGRNNLMFWLGSGWYSSKLPGVVNEGPLVKAQLEQISDNIRKTVVATDSSWVGRISSYTRIDTWRNHHFGGETVNGGLSSTDLTIDNPDRSWNHVKEVVVPEQEISPQMVENNRIEETIHPIGITQLSDRTFLVDMGKNLTGWVEIHFSGLEKSQEITIEYSDLNESVQFASQKQIDRYIASGVGKEVFKNKFNYHGFRYIKISNLAKAPEAHSIKAYLIHTGYELASGFICSDPDLNKIHNMVFYTLRCLSLGGYLVDCPQIERLGYGGDGNASTTTAQTMFNLDPLYANWLQAWADCMYEDGGMPHTAPSPYSAGGGPYWCGFIITASWNTYLNYGDSLILKKYYPTMQKWLRYVDKYMVNGLLRHWPENENRSWYLGDWATPHGIDQKAEASVDLINNCFIAVCYDRMQRIANILGKTDDAGVYLRKKELLKKQIHQSFFDPSKSSYATGTQIDLTYPMLAGVVPDSLTGAVTNSLVNEIKNNREGHFATGLVGIPVFTEWAIKSQATELMYSMLKKKGYPGYMDMIDNGATTTWELWDGGRSRIHNCYNGIGTWFYQAAGGIRPVENVPAYQKVRIQPQIPNGITWAKTFKETPYGKLVVNWKLTGQKFDLELEIPVGMEAEVPLPKKIKRLKINREANNQCEKNNSSINLKSGRYNLSFLLIPNNR